MGQALLASKLGDNHSILRRHWAVITTPLGGLLVDKLVGKLAHKNGLVFPAGDLARLASLGNKPLKNTRVIILLLEAVVEAALPYKGS